MRIEDLGLEVRSGKARLTATIVWEDSDRPTQEVFYEVDEEYVDYLTLSPHPFLVGSILPALHNGEERVFVDQEICPELRNGLLTAMGWIRHWYGLARDPVRIETKPTARWPMARPEERAGSFLSGGIDSLATLRANRLDFPLDHPLSIKDCLIVHGFDIGAFEGGDKETAAYERAVSVLREIAADAKVTLIPIYTNVRHLEDGVEFWMHQFHGAALSSVAHALSGRLSSVRIGSCYAIPDQRPWGTHPVLDPNYSSVDLQVRHDAVRLTRFEKAKLVADWDVALQNLRVCWTHPKDVLNCGKCDKCIWTMLELLAAGKLAQTRAFPVRDVSPELLETITIRSKFQESFYREMIDPLLAIGRDDLVHVIESKSIDFRKHLAWEEERDWKGALKRLDRRVLGGKVRETYKSLRERVIRRNSR